MAYAEHSNTMLSPLSYLASCFLFCRDVNFQTREARRCMKAGEVRS